MRPCRKCSASNWKYRKENDGSVTATCSNCLDKVNWLPKNARALVATKKDQSPTSLVVKDGMLVF